jgi:SAM-dependent methyltransferase
MSEKDMRYSLKPQIWAAYITIAAAVLSVVALITGNLLWAAASALVAIGSWLAARFWNRRNPIPMPSSLRWFMFIPRGQSPESLARILNPKAGERILEIGPGPGVHALPIAKALFPGGVLEALDIQPEMLDHLKQRAEKAGVTNIVTTKGDAQALAFPSGTFDAAYMIGTLGEIPDDAAALGELRRVLKSEGRLVIGEVFIDPDFVSLAALREKAKTAGFVFERASGPKLSYFVLFRKSAGERRSV